MKNLILASLFTLLSCGETVNNFESLSDKEKENLRERGKQQCLQDNREDFNSFKSQSAEEFADLQRGDYYLHEVKNGSTVLRTVKIQVWKKLSGNLYFILTTTTAEDSTPSYQFIKITTVVDSEMIDQAATARCNSGIEGVTASSSSSSITYTKETIVPIEGERKTVTTKTNTASFQYLALFANYNYQQTVKTLTLDDETTDVADVTTTGTITEQTTIDLAFATYTSYSGASYCVPFASGTPKYTFPFTINCTQPNPEFDPTELAF